VLRRRDTGIDGEEGKDQDNEEESQDREESGECKNILSKVEAEMEVKKYYQ